MIQPLACPERADRAAGMASRRTRGVSAVGAQECQCGVALGDRLRREEHRGRSELPFSMLPTIVRHMALRQVDAPSSRNAITSGGRREWSPSCLPPSHRRSGTPTSCRNWPKGARHVSGTGFAAAPAPAPGSARPRRRTPSMRSAPAGRSRSAEISSSSSPVGVGRIAALCPHRSSRAIRLDVSQRPPPIFCTSE